MSSRQQPKRRRMQHGTQSVRVRHSPSMSPRRLRQRQRASPRVRARAKPKPKVRVQARMIHAALAGRPTRPTIKGDGTQVHRQAVATKAGATAKDGEKAVHAEYQGYPTIT